MKIIPFGVIWFVFSIVYLQLEKGILANLKYYPSTGNPYNFSRSIYITPVVALLTGLMLGTIETLYFSKWFRLKSFSKKILYKSFIYLAAILLFLSGLTVIANSIELKTFIFDQRVWHNLFVFVSNYAFWSIVVYIAVILVVAQFYAEVSESDSDEGEYEKELKYLESVSN